MHSLTISDSGRLFFVNIGVGAMTTRKVILITGPLVVLCMLAGFLLARTNQSKADTPGCGSKSGITHQITIQNNQVSPQITDGKLCDKLTFINDDNVTREIAFGPHEHHVPYDGIAERLLSKNRSFTITLNKAGMYHFHDHIHDEVAGYFNVYK